MPVTPIRLTRGVPPAESFEPAKLVACAETALTEHGNAVLQYSGSRGFAPLRQQIASEMGVDPERVIVGQGSLQLQDIFARTFLHPGDVAYVEEPTYDRTLTVLRRPGANVEGWPLGADGPDVEALARRLAGGERPVVFYVIPDFQNPSGTVMAEACRRRLAELAREYSFWIIEDSPYRKLRYRGSDVPTLFELAPDRVLHMSSYSKLISPGLRVGYVVAPQTVADRLARAAEDTYINPSYINQAMVYDFARRGWLDPHIEELKALYRPRLDAMLAALDVHLAGLGTWSRPAGGFFIGLTLHRQVRAEDLLQAAERAGLVLTDGRGFHANGGGDQFVRLPFCALTTEEIATGIERLGAVVRSM